MSTPANAPFGADPVELEAGEIAHLVHGRLEGDPKKRLRGVAPLDQAGPGELGFLAMGRYVKHLAGCEAGGLLVSSDLEEAAIGVEGVPPTRVVVDDAHRALAVLLERFHPARPVEPGVHDTAVLGAGVELGRDVTIGPYVVIGEDATVGDGTRIDAHVVVGRGSRIGAGCHLHPQVVLYPGSAIGTRVILHSGVRVGVDGFGYVTVDGEHRKLPQVGSCVIGDDVEIGANCTLDRGSIGRTVVGEGSKLDNLVHLGHNVEVGERSILVAQVGIAGSTRLGRGVVCGGQAGIIGHAEIGDGARIGAQGGVIGDVAPGETVAGFPARDHKEYLRAMSLVFRLPELRRRVRELEARLDAGEGRTSSTSASAEDPDEES